MAEIVLGIGTSHSPMLSTPIEEFEGHQTRDRQNPTIPDFEDRASRLADEMAAHLTPEVAAAKHARNQQAIARLHDEFVGANLDAVVIVGDDQAEWFEKDAMPALAVYWGDWVESRPPPVEDMHPTLRSGYWGHYGDGTNNRYPVAADLGESLVGGLTAAGFDIYSMKSQPEHEHLGHAWGFVYQRIMIDITIPIVPILLNTYFPPNQPSGDRCWKLGEAVNEVVRSFPGDMRVGVVGSGGLSHFVVDEEFDRELLTDLGNNDAEKLAAIPASKMQYGSSEARNWIVAGGASQHLSMEVVDYVPFYRSPAGSGIGAGFALWK